MTIKPRMTVRVNGEAISLLEDSTLADLIMAMGLENKRIAIECDGVIIPRSQYATIAITPENQLEIVHAIGGG